MRPMRSAPAMLNIQLDHANILTSQFCFHPVKTATTGEGGAALLTMREQQKMEQLRSHGVTRDSSSFVSEALLCGAMSNIPWDLTTG